MLQPGLCAAAGIEGCSALFSLSRINYLPVVLFRARGLHVVFEFGRAARMDISTPDVDEMALTDPS